MQHSPAQSELLFPSLAIPASGKQYCQDTVTFPNAYMKTVIAYTNRSTLVKFPTYLGLVLIFIEKDAFRIQHMKAI